MNAAVLRHNQTTLEKCILILKHVSGNVPDLKVLGAVCTLGSNIFLTNTKFEEHNHAIADILIQVLKSTTKFGARSS